MKHTLFSRTTRNRDPDVLQNAFCLYCIFFYGRFKSTIGSAFLNISIIQRMYEFLANRRIILLIGLSILPFLQPSQYEPSKDMSEVAQVIERGVAGESS
jgi:hypothetical protein